MSPGKAAGGGRPGTPSGRGRAQPGRAQPGRTQRARPGPSRRPGGQGRPPGPPQPPVDVHDPDGVRLQKVLAQAGLGSRRACEELIASGRVEVDGQVVREQGVRVDPERAVVRVDGNRLQLDSSRVYLALNKPRGVVSTMTDPQGRACVGDIVGQRKERLFHVGRLDTDTEGLLLLTNDGELAHRLQHPSYGVLKTYLAEIPGPVPRDLGRRLRAGVELEDGPVAVDSFRLIDSSPGRALVEVVLHEGRKHVVRRLLAEVGHPVRQLVRVRVGPVALGDLVPGRTRALTREEIGQLMGDAGL
jgi:23S rRNA pseudouridine2605 synthase